MASNNESTVEERVLQVADWLFVPYSSSEVVGLCRTTWGVARSTAFEYMRQANERIAAEGQKHIEAEFAKAKGRMERIARKAEEKGEYNASIAAQKELNRLLGLAAPEKVEHSVDQTAAGLLAALVGSSDQPKPL